jgi:excisionase family DNA binding protein
MSAPAAEWLSIKQVAAAWGRSDRHVSECIRDGRIPADKVKRDGTRSVRIHRSVAYPEIAAKVIPFPQLISMEQLQAVADAAAETALDRLIERLFSLKQSPAARHWRSS